MYKSFVFLFSFVLSILALQPSAQGQITARNTTPESCSPGHDGVAEVLFTNWTSVSAYDILWTFPDQHTESSRIISGLTHGNYHVKVSPHNCPTKVVYESDVYVEQEEDCNELKLSITGQTSAISCGIPTVDLQVSASGGTPPYSYSWPGRHKTVSGVGTFTVSCTVEDSEGKTATESKTVYLQQIACSSDPNEIYGPEGYDDSIRYVSATDKMNYTIRFENDPDFATAPATRVSITYPVPANQNISSFRLADFGFGDFVFSVPSNTTSYSTRLDVSDSLGVWVDVTAGIDIINRQLFWIFQSIDPATGFEPASSQMGFLPVNDSTASGEGYVSFLIEPKSGLHTGDTVSADATIVFDDNAPIPTNVWRNTFDAIAPVSHLQASVSSDDSTYCTLSFTASDDIEGSGVNRVELFVSQNDGPYIFFASCPPDSTIRFSLQDGIMYQFVSVAVDNVGNREPMKTMADTVISTSHAPTDIMLAKSYFYDNDPAGSVVGQLSTTDNDITLPFTYELVSGMGDDDNPKFTIEGNNLLTNGTFSCTGQFSYSVRIRTTNISGLSYEEAFEITKVQQNYPQALTMVRQICQSDSIQFGNRILMTSGVYTDSLQTAKGCDSVVTLNLNVLPIYSVVENAVACDSLRWFDSLYTISTSNPFKNLYTKDGCDSVVSLHLTVHSTTTGNDIQTACDSYTWMDGTTYQSSTNSPEYTIQNVNGCDSIVTLHLTINHSTTSTETITACDTYSWHGNTYSSTTNTPTYSTINTLGCDSIITLHLTINNSTTGVVNATACDTYSWHGSTYTASTHTPTFTATNSVGCDSTVTLHLTINNSSTAIENQTACDSYTWHGTAYTASTNTPTYSTTNAVGCDSTVTLHLTINNSTAGTETLTACDTYTWHGSTYTASTNTPTFLTTNTAGCDSTVTLHLTINNSSTSTVTATACDTYTWHGTAYTASTNTPTYSTTNAVGCDSTVTLHLTINNSTACIVTASACDSYTWHGNTYSNSSIDSITTTNAAGCDSTVTLHLTVNYSNSGIEVANACNSFTWHGITYTASTNTPTYTSLNAAGCDSVTTLHLTISQSLATVETITACDSYTWHGTTYTTSTNTPTYSTTASGGCDSTVTLHLTINNSSTATETATACDSYTWHGTAYTASTTTPTYTSLNAAGCDSIVTLHLTINNSNTATETLTACDSYTWHGTAYTASTNTPTYTSLNASGCDSTVTLHLTIHYSNSATETLTACDSYIWHGTAYTTSTNTPTFTTLNAAGCDSTVTLYLTINSSTTSSESATACDSYSWHGTDYTASTNTATYTTTNAVGCDSTVTLQLTINYSTTSTESVTACDSYIWNGTTYTNSSIDSITSTNSVGCDSTTILHLTLNYSTSAIELLAACDSLEWHGTTYTESTDTPSFSTTNAYGCDSTVTLHLTINYSSRTTIFDTATNSYEWNGETYTESGEYVYEGLTEAGCDSIVVLQLTINQVGIADIPDLDGFTIYPNPTTGKLTIGAEGVLKVEVYDHSGRLVATFSNTNQLDISQLPTGTYALRISLQKGNTVRRVIKR